MKPWAVVLFIVLGIAFVFIAVWYSKYKRRARAVGLLVNRKGGFYDYAEIFLIRKVSINDVWESLNQLIKANAVRDCMKTAELKGYQITVKHENMGYTWTAFIQEMEEPKARPEVSVFRVMFPQYFVKNGTPDTATMNRFLTEIEKLFLRLDPDTLVRSQRPNDTLTEN